MLHEQVCRDVSHETCLPSQIADTRDAVWNETFWTLLAKTRKRLLRCIRSGGKTWDLLKTLWIDL